ncbi:helix-turn-helix transcriptional regulator [Vibrio parahaemolyticus]|nr:helix-turn-helix transcriptional regulator [Vibrio parahaemolyticus]
MKDKVTSYTTLTMLIVKETRIERNLSQASMADRCSKRPNAWAKIENGTTTFSLDSFFLSCNALATPPAVFMNAVDRYAVFLSQHGWSVLKQQLPEDEDKLLKEAKKYYASEYHKNNSEGFRWDSNSVLNTPLQVFGGVQVSNVFKYAVDDDFRKTVDNQ